MSTEFKISEAKLAMNIAIVKLIELAKESPEAFLLWTNGNQEMLDEINQCTDMDKLKTMLTHTGTIEINFKINKECLDYYRNMMRAAA